MHTTSDNAAAEQAAHTLVRLCAGVLPVWARQLEASRLQSEAAVAQMLQAFAVMGPHLPSAVPPSQPSTQAPNPDGGAMAEQVERMYLGFQYQDRISQMLALLEGDMARLQLLLDGDNREVPELCVWLSRLEAGYAMAEQRQSHGGVADAVAGGSKETTFF